MRALTEEEKARWLRGGCLVLADALRERLPFSGGHVAVVTCGDVRIHALYVTGGVYWDAYGPHSAREARQAWQTASGLPCAIRKMRSSDDDWFLYPVDLEEEAAALADRIATENNVPYSSDPPAVAARIRKIKNEVAR